MRENFMRGENSRDARPTNNAAWSLGRIVQPISWNGATTCLALDGTMQGPSIVRAQFNADWTPSGALPVLRVQSYSLEGGDVYRDEPLPPWGVAVPIGGGTIRGEITITTATAAALRTANATLSIVATPGVLCPTWGAWLGGSITAPPTPLFVTPAMVRGARRVRLTPADGAITIGGPWGSRALAVGVTAELPCVPALTLSAVGLQPVHVIAEIEVTW